MIQHIVFDWDGTLANTYPTIIAAYNYTFSKMGEKNDSLSIEEIIRITSKLQNKDTMSYIFGDRKEEAKKYFYEYINLHHTDNLTPTAGAIDLLEFCKTHHIKCYLISNKTNKASGDKEAYLTTEVKKLDMEKYFEKIQGAGETEEDKPSPKATHALFNYNLPNPNNLLIIGDGVADYKTAQTYIKDSQAPKVIIYDPENLYSEPKPDYKISNLKSVIEIIKAENKI